MKCFGFHDNDNQRTKQGGYCIIADTDGDHAYFIYEANDTRGFEIKGTFDYTGGTGKYKGITGKNAFRLVAGEYGRAIWNDAPPRKVPVLGLFGNRGAGGGPDYFGQHFFGSMRALGWNDNYIPMVFAGLPGDELTDAARGLLAQRPTMILAWGDSPTRTAQSVTTSVPIIGLADDMTASGLVASLARPGRNTTGISILSPELNAKRPELLHEMVPQARRVSILFDPEYTAMLPQVEAAATQLG